METELKNLIDQIKKEGVDKASEDGAAIIEEAQKKADSLLEDARVQADNLKKKAQAEIELHKKNTEQALKQAARDTLLALRERVVEFAQRVLRENVEKELSTKMLTDVISKAIDHCVREKTMDIEILVNEKEKTVLEKALMTALKKEARDKVLIKGTKSINKGFRIGEKDKNFYLDFTDESILESFKKYLNPKLVDALGIDLGLIEQHKNGE